MPTPDPCRAWHPLVAALAVDDLSADERTAVGAHLDGCAACRADLDDLRRAAAALPAADPSKLNEHRHPPRELDRRVFTMIATQRRRRTHQRVVAGALGVAAAISIVLGVTVTRRVEPAKQWVQLASSAHVQVQASLGAKAWGTQISLRSDGFAPGTTCSAWLERSDGTRVPAGSFTSLQGRTVTVLLASSVPSSQTVAVGLTSTNGQQLRTVLR
jgi:anti-sigma factor RsiW